MWKDRGWLKTRKHSNTSMHWLPSHLRMYKGSASNKRYNRWLLCLNKYLHSHTLSTVYSIAHFLYRSRQSDFGSPPPGRMQSPLPWWVEHTLRHTANSQLRTYVYSAQKKAIGGSKCCALLILIDISKHTPTYFPCGFMSSHSKKVMEMCIVLTLSNHYILMYRHIHTNTFSDSTYVCACTFVRMYVHMHQSYL